MPSFQIGDAPTQVTLQPPSAGGARPSGSVSFPIRNLTAKAQTGRIKIEPLGSAKPEWFALEGAPSTSPTELERDFEPSGSQVAVVKVTTPPDAPAGAYTFQLRVTAEHDPDTDVVLGPVVGFNVMPVAPAAPKGSFPWWAVAVAAVMVLIVGGVVAYFMMQPSQDDSTLVAIPPVAGRSHVEAGQALASAGFGVLFGLTPQGDVGGLQAIGSDPKEGTRAAPGSTVTLQVKSPNDGPCNSVICSFPNQVFPPDIISLLGGQNFDQKFAPALSVSSGKIAVDNAKFAAILNPPVPEAPVARVRLPRLQTLDIIEASNIILDLGLTIEAVAVADGTADGQVRRSIPAGPLDLQPGTSVVVLYHPKPRASCGRRIFCHAGTVVVRPEMAHQLKASGYAVNDAARVMSENRRIILSPEMLQPR